MAADGAKGHVRLGVAGVAGMGRTHIRVAPDVDGYELAAVCDVNPKYLGKAAESAPGTKVFGDLAELCSSGTVDAVALATPNWVHADNVRQVLDAGLHVYCEKPLGMTVRECREIAELADRAGRKLQVGFQHRFQHGYASAKRVAGELGPLKRAELRATDWFRPDVYFAARDWRAKWSAAGGGVLMMQAIHQLDAFLWIAGVPSRVQARAWSGRTGVEVEDDVSAILEFPDGATGILTASTLVPGGTNRVELTFDGGLVRAEGERARVGTWEASASEIRATSQNPFEFVGVSWRDLEPQGDAMTFDECVTSCHRDFVDAIRDDREPLNNAVEATKSVEVANAVYLSAVIGEPVDLPLDASRYDDVFTKLSAGELVLPEA